MASQKLNRALGVLRGALRGVENADRMVREAELKDIGGELYVRAKNRRGIVVAWVQLGRRHATVSVADLIAYDGPEVEVRRRNARH